jgi:hypothetical protein
MLAYPLTEERFRAIVVEVATLRGGRVVAVEIAASEEV